MQSEVATLEERFSRIVVAVVKEGEEEVEETLDAVQGLHFGIEAALGW